MTQFITLAAAGAEGDKGMLETFGVNAPLFISQLIAFTIVALLLKKFAYKPVLDMLEQRKTRIAEAEANAEKIKSELAETESARDKILEEARSEANRLIEETRSAAAELKEAKTQEAISSAEAIIAKAQEAATAERDKLMAELKQEVGRLVVETTCKVTGKVLTAEDQQRLIEDANKEIAA
ncbi:MAG: ATP synthase F0 subunit B [Euryarchaeota archaeon]|nr:ATP synthase F0 subunit B [Euryarchaeota archaeon]